MKISKKNIELKDCLEREWIITNGIGGFCSSTIVGANTRRYHGLLVAPLKVPAQRHLIISKVDESVEINGEHYDLYVNVCREHISDGFKYLDTFEKEFLPIFNYKVKDIKIEKTISMVYGHNTVVVKYNIKNGRAASKFTFTPIVNFRNFHDMTTGHDFYSNQSENNNKVKLEIDNNVDTPIYFYLNDGKYIVHNNDKFRNMMYLKEAERGFFPEEDLLVPGRYEVELKARESKEIVFVASLESNVDKIDANEVISKEIQRQKDILKSSGCLIRKSKVTKEEKDYNELMESLLISADSFIINRPKFKTHSIIAGFPWFLDWGRDTLISFEGLVLIPKRYDLAKEILLTFTKDIKSGLVPNGYSEYDDEPLYNSADASLLLFEQVNKYIQYTKDYEFIEKKLYKVLKDIIKNYKKSIDLCDNNIYIDEDNLLCSGTETTQNTWMDAKIDNYAVTPRNGKVVELNALWYNALKTMETLANKFDDKNYAEKMKKMAQDHQISFEEKFYNHKKKSLYDVLGDDKIRPNQLFAIATTYPVIKPSSEIGKAILKTCRTKLLTKYGLRTLAKNEPGYIKEYSGDAVKRDMSYHQGPVWVWLIGLYHDALKNVIDDDKDRIEKETYIIEYEKLISRVIKTFKTEINNSDCIGSINELYDSEVPFNPGGCFAQAWSISEIIKIVRKYK